MSEPQRTTAPAHPPQATNTPFECIALLLQGGGALGAYQAGVYEALCEREIAPTWISGISIGAINSALIAGNAPKHRVEKLRAFWEEVTSGSVAWAGWMPMLAGDDTLRGVVNQVSALGVLTGGVPGFFAPRFPPPPLHVAGSPDATSWYDTSALRGTLENLVDFDRINAKELRFSVGAVNVRTGNFAYFDNETDTIRPEHVMASGALPPGFAAVEIDGEYYWDGGLVSNTPLDWVLSAKSKVDTLIFQVDLWSASGPVPVDLASLAVRTKEIQFSSRTRAATEQFRETQKLRAAFHALHERLPDELKETDEARLLFDVSDEAVYNIVQLIYHSPTYEGQSKDYEFSRQTMEDHWRAGYENAVATLEHPEVLTPPTETAGVNVYDFVNKDRANLAPAKAPRRA